MYQAVEGTFMKTYRLLVFKAPRKVLSWTKYDGTGVQDKGRTLSECVSDLDRAGQKSAATELASLLQQALAEDVTSDQVRK